MQNQAIPFAGMHKNTTWGSSNNINRRASTVFGGKRLKEVQELYSDAEFSSENTVSDIEMK